MERPPSSSRSSGLPGAEPSRSLLRVAWAVSIAAAVGQRGWNALCGPMLHGYDSWAHLAYVLFIDLYHAIPYADQGWSYFHPPLHYLLGFALAQAGSADVLARGLALLGSLESLGVAALGSWLVARALPDRRWLACLAFTSLAFLPVHVYASPMPSNEMLASFWVAAAVAVFLTGEAPHAGREPARRARRDLAVGALVGLGILCKANALVGLAAILGTLLVASLGRFGAATPPAAALRRAALILAAALAIASPYLVRNALELGTPLPATSHARHAELEKLQAPGERTLYDFVAPPGIALLRDSRFDAPHLVRSVWGSTYLNAWFDTYRASQFPRWREVGIGERPIHGVTLAMAAVGLLPSALAAFGFTSMLVRIRRQRESPRAIFDLGMLVLAAVTLAFHVAFVVRVPTFAAVKATYLLNLSLPFAWSTAVGALALFTSGRRRLLGLALAGTLVEVAATFAVFTSGLVFPMRADLADIHALRASFGSPESARARLAEPGVMKQRAAIELAAAVEMREGGYERARSLLVDIAGGPVSAAFANALATATALAGDPGQALRLWNQLLDADRSLPEALANRGAVRASLGDLAGGRADIERAAARGHASPPAWSNLAWILDQQGLGADARAMRERAEQAAARPPRGFPYGVGEGDPDFAGRDERWLLVVNDEGLSLYRPRRARWGRPHRDGPG